MRSSLCGRTLDISGEEQSHVSCFISASLSGLLAEAVTARTRRAALPETDELALSEGDACCRDEKSVAAPRVASRMLPATRAEARAQRREVAVHAFARARGREHSVAANIGGSQTHVRGACAPCGSRGDAWPEFAQKVRCVFFVEPTANAAPARPRARRANKKAERAAELTFRLVCGPSSCPFARGSGPALL